MKVQNYRDIPAQEVEEGASGVKIRWLITEDMGAPNFVMRHFEIAPGGHTPLHTHSWEHEVFILSGKDVLKDGPDDRPFGAGDVIFVGGDEEHQFRNTGDEALTLLCLIPSRDKCAL